MRLSPDERARNEIGVVVDCREDYEKRASDVDAQIKKMESELTTLDALVAAKIGGRPLESIPDAEFAEIDDLQDRIETLEATIEDHRLLLTQFRRSANLLDSLHKTLCMFYERGDFKFVIKNIPEKRLPALVGDVNKISSVLQLVEKLEKKFSQENARILAKIEASGKRRRRAREVARTSRSLNTDAHARRERLERRYGATATAEAPIDVTAPNTNTNANTTPNTNTNPS